MDSSNHLSYADYQRLRSADPASWSENDLARFLVLDLFEVPDATIIGKDYQAVYIKQQQEIIHKYNALKMGFDLFDTVFSNYYSKTKKRGKKNILFQGARYGSLILEAKKEYHVGLITEGKKDRLFAMRNFLGSIGTNDLNRYVFSYVQEKDMRYLYQLMKKIEEKLVVMRPDFVVLWDDSSCIARAIILASRKLGISNAVIQHGAYDSRSYLSNCKAAQYVFVWGQYVKDFFVAQGIRGPEDMYVLGYPYPQQKIQVAADNLKTVCYLGQDFETYDNDLLSIKIENVEKLSRICKKLGVAFFYRPHPGDNRKLLQEKMPGIPFAAKGETLKETIARADVFIGFNSTALAQAAMERKISLQLMNYPMETDNFEKLGACSKSCKNIVELENYLKAMAESHDLDKFRIKFNHYYIETRYNFGQRFSQILQELEKKKHHA